ncbi:MAG TPA: hypothetical protein VHB54_09700 [Mucilaginibacter sp.]|nr:hypothetical protein [Mucilaginibacter sp.]
MKQLFIAILLFNAVTIFGQSNPAVPIGSKALIHHGSGKKAGKDTVIEKDTSKENKEPRYFYLSGTTNAFVNTKGGFAKRFAPSFEFGRTYGIFDIGLAFGQLSSYSNSVDTSRFIEFRPTINIFSKGRFSEGLCLGGGYIFGAKQGLMTEICNSINFNISANLTVAVLQGYVFIDGTNSSRSTQYMGFCVTYNFLRAHSVNKRRKKQAIISDN